jgi:hypothetical protein
MPDPFLSGLHTDPNAFSYPLASGGSDLASGGQGGWDKSKVAELLAKAQEGVKKEGTIEEGVGRLVKAATATHALARNIRFLTDETEAENLGTSCEMFAKNAEAAARIFAHKTGSFETSAIPPHDLVLRKMFL